MKIITMYFFLIVFLFQTIHAQENEKSGSPYFMIQGDSGVEAFPLLSTSVDVNITGPIADVVVKQSYKNDGTVPIEAVYVFPASTRAAVHHMEMQIGERRIIAEIKEKQKAQQIYVEAKEEGKRASLLQQHKPNVFQMNVANIMPGEEINVILKYVEFIIPENQSYRFIYPTVVGPRYTNHTEEESSFEQNPFMRAGNSPTYTFDINVGINMPFPIIDIGSKSHTTDINYYSASFAEVQLAASEIYGGNRDFVLEYNLSGAAIASGVHTYDTGSEKFFLCQVEPPDLDYKPEINAREFIFVLDVSGSMHGFPLDIARELMRNLLNQMRPTDRFNILFFSGGSFALNPASIEATQSNIQNAFFQMESYSGSGGTQLLPALRKALSFPKQEGFSRSFVIVTDGYVAVEEATFNLISNSLGDANFFTFGIGSGVNRYLIEGMANVGRGIPFIVTERKHARKEARKLKRYIESPVLTDIEIKGSNIEILDVIPEKTPDLLAERPIYYFGKYKGGANSSFIISGMSGTEKWTKTLELPLPSADNDVLPFLWAREKIRLYDDFNTLNTQEYRIREITALGLEYNLLTKYTSFVAVDHTPVVNSSDTRQVKQPLPLPQGVSDLAVGFEMDIEEVILDGDAISEVEVMVECEDKMMKKISEAILETYLSDLHQMDIVELIGLSIELEIHPGGTVEVKNGDNTSLE
ncbi:MAG: VWA domain-containing protein, partial [Bacteroidia bacterium]|nr:VWA domain-containing protein [Bacteroidia bacterium]